MSASPNTLMLSALQHYAYCPRQFALIHLEQAWADNFFTAQGNALHERVDSGVAEQRGGVRFERSVEVHSDRWRLRGKLDLLEIEKVNAPLAGAPTHQYFPVEYKRGKPKIEAWDKIQLCAQALCLEEMRSINIREGALWYWQVRRREPVLFDAALRAQTLATIQSAHALYDAGQTPAPGVPPKRCKACSLVELCQPQTFRQDRSAVYIQHLFAADDDNLAGAP